MRPVKTDRTPKAGKATAKPASQSSKKRICARCDGIGKTSDGDCNCGSGEDCTMHNASARALWGSKCTRCNGTGLEPE